jgi:hypothetical protein
LQIIKYAETLFSFLEIGTWNGLGNTKCFIKGFQNRTDDNYIFYSLECNLDKCKYAIELYKNEKNVNILNEVLYNNEPTDIYKIFPILNSDETFKMWHKCDMDNMKQCNLFLNRKNIPQIFDVLLLDGGEFTTYFEFQILKNKCKLLLLDDINTYKCQLIVKEIECNPTVWKILDINNNLRNGYMICQNLLNK